MMKKKIKIDFVGFYGINKNNNTFTNILSKEFDVEISDRPDLLFFGQSNHMHKLYTCKKLFYTNETIDPDWNETDYAITYHYLTDSRHLRVPYYALGTPGVWQNLIKSDQEVDQLLKLKRNFCSAVISNGNPRRTKERINFFNKLSEYGEIGSGGSFKNNTGPIVDGPQGKIDFIKNYKFNIAFENKLLPGYVTEKLTDAMVARTIPLYWGCERVGEEFNKKSFLCRNDFESDVAFIEYILKVHNDDALFEKILREPYLINNQPNIYFNQSRISDFLLKVIDDDKQPISRNKKIFSFGRWKLTKRDYFY
jgi:alpha(1,3/1,4) fucosyltransferase